MPKISNVKDNPVKTEVASGFIGGLNTFQDETLIKDSELTIAKNIILTVDGVEPRPGILHYGGSNSESRVFGAFGFYKSDGTNEFLRMSGGKLYKKNGSLWTQIGSTTWNATARTEFLQVRDRVYIFNGVDPVRYYDGSTVTTYTTLSTPSGLATYKVGTAGTTPYSYRISAFNTVGETLACTAVPLLLGNSLLDATNYNVLTWALTTGATGYNIWGRESTALGETYMTTVYQIDLYNEDIVDADINTGTDVITVLRDCVTREEVKFGGSGVMPTGITAGTSYFVYRVSATTIKLCDTADHATAGTNFIDITAVGSGIRTMTFQTVATFADKGEYDPSTVTLPPEGNTTEGPICKKGIFSQSRIFMAGDPSQPSRLYYGGVGSNVGNFSFSELGGGATDIFKNDGQKIRDLVPFQGGVIVFKDNAIYKFYFNSSGLPTLEEITRSFGGIAWRGSVAVENDIIFPAKKDGRLAFYSLGNQENYSAGILRTNELSIKIASGGTINLTDVNESYLENAASFYFNSIFGCAVTLDTSTINNRIWCLDTRFGAWSHWDDLYPNGFVRYVDSSGNEKMYYFSDNTGYIEEMFYETRSDNGTAISVQFATKSFNEKQFLIYKKYMNPVFQFKNITTSGALEGDIITDGAIASGNFTVNQQSTGGGGFGTYLVGFHMPGETPSVSVATPSSADTIVELNYQSKARSIKYEFRSSTVGVKYKLLSIAHRYKLLEGKRLPSSTRYYV